MIDFDDVPVYLACGATDLKKQINGLSVLLSSLFELDPFSPALFCFCNKNKNRIKILTFDADGFVLTFKRLEKGRFIWPGETEDKGMMELDIDEFRQLLSTTRLVRKSIREREQIFEAVRFLRYLLKLSLLSLRAEITNREIRAASVTLRMKTIKAM